MSYCPIAKKIKRRRENSKMYILMSPYGKILTTNATGVKILDLCDGQHDIDSMYQELSSYTEVAESQIKEDIKFFLNQLTKAGVLINADHSESE